MKYLNLTVLLLSLLAAAASPATLEKTRSETVCHHYLPGTYHLRGNEAKLEATALVRLNLWYDTRAECGTSEKGRYNLHIDVSCGNSYLNRRYNHLNRVCAECSGVAKYTCN
jgi:hypothetical protein